MEFATHYNRTPSSGEKNNGERITEKAGYIPAKKQIENLIYAGQRLESSRRDSYDFDDEHIDENYTDPTRSVGYDLADASIFQRNLSQKAKAEITAKKIAADAEKKASKEAETLPKSE